MRWRWLALLSVLAGCFSPDPPEGVSCSESGRCPPGQECELGVCRNADGTSDAAVDASTPQDGGTPDAISGRTIGGVCAADVDCQLGLGLSCFLDGPGRNPNLGFCTTSCLPGPGGDADCQALDADLPLFCFERMQLLGVCAIACASTMDDACPPELDCQVGSDVQQPICDVSAPVPMPEDAGGPGLDPPDDAGV